MKKYIAPEVEIKKFAVENIMEGSAVPVTDTTTAAADAAANGTLTVGYNDLFTL